jgi:hypothetical protein
MATTVAQHSIATFTSPINGTTPIDANSVRGNDNTIRSSYNDHDADAGIHLQSSALSARPVAGDAGRKWLTNDTGAVRLYLDTGSAWAEISYLPLAGGTVAGNVSVTGTLAVTGVLTASGGVVGNITGNADTATKLSSSRTFAVTGDVTGSVSSDLTTGASIGTTLASGVVSNTNVSASAAIAYSKLALTGSIVNADVSASAAIADTKLATISTAGKVANSATTAVSTNTANAIVARDASGNFAAGTITAALTGNASTATTLQTARTINGVSFNGSADITVAAAAGTLTGTTLASNVTASSLTSVGTLANLTVTNPITGSVTGSSGSTTGNAATATALQTARNINGVSFNGTADITVAAAAGTLTGTTLASNVVSSSLTSVGTLTTLAISGAGGVRQTINGSTGSAFTDYQVGGTSLARVGTQNFATGDMSLITLTAAPIVFGINNAERMRLDASGRLGIGVASPGVVLDVTAATGCIRLISSTGTNQSFGTYENTGGTLRVGVDSSAGGVLASGSAAYSGVIATTGAQALAFGTNAAERMRLTASGDLGVGTASPASRLEVNGAVRVGADVSSVSLYTNTGWRHTGSSGLYIDANQGGAANGVFIRNGSGFTTQLTLDSSGNLGLGVTPSAWPSGFRALDIGTNGALNSDASFFQFSANRWLTAGGTNTYKTTGFAGIYSFSPSGGAHAWFNAPSGTAGNAITFTQAMTLDASGNLGIGSGAATPARRLHVSGSGVATFIRVTDAGANHIIDFGTQSADVAQLAVFNTTLANGSKTLWLTASDHVFNTWNGSAYSTRMTLDSSGNLALASGYMRVAGASAGAASTTTIGNTTATTVGAAGGASALPATPLGYIIAHVGTTQVKIPYYTA